LFPAFFINFAGLKINIKKMMRIIISFLVLTLSFQIMAQNSQPETLIVIHTKYGDMTAMLYNDTPKHRDNFIKLVKEGWYEGSQFHRVIEGFMIQGGMNKNGKQDPGYKIDAEILPNHFHKKGALAAARMGDRVNPEKKSSGSQFYIVQGEVVDDSYLERVTAATGHKFTEEQKKVYETIGGTPHLDGGYTVFGEVLDGFDVIDKIAAVKTGPGNKPVEPVIMSIEILE
jgi:peptidyl-prolyl cis-trans isomerase B (cyclophilin B)